MKLVLVFSALLLTSCGYIYNSEWKTAESNCRDRGGVRSVATSLSAKRVEFYCEDGTKMDTVIIKDAK